jgi:hypothetical protein
MKGFPQFGMGLGGGIDEGIDPVFPGDGDAVEDPYLVAVHGIPLRGPVGVVIGDKPGVPGGFGEKHRGNPRLFPYKEMKAPVHPLFNPEILRPEATLPANGGIGGILTINGVYQEEKPKKRKEAPFHHVLIIGLWRWFQN